MGTRVRAGGFEVWCRPHRELLRQRVQTRQEEHTHILQCVWPGVHLVADQGSRPSITNLPVESERQRLWDLISTRVVNCGALRCFWVRCRVAALHWPWPLTSLKVSQRHRGETERGVTQGGEKTNCNGVTRDRDLTQFNVHLSDDLNPKRCTHWMESSDWFKDINTHNSLNTLAYQLTALCPCSNYSINLAVGWKSFTMFTTVYRRPAALYARLQ